MAKEQYKIRYDQWAKFYNPTSRDFVGKWDGEEYLIKAGTSNIFPVWLCRHFAKRLCDTEMIRMYRVPLRPGDPRRAKFIATLSDHDLLADIDTTPNKRKISMKEQIEADRSAQVEAEEELAGGEGQILQSADGTLPAGEDEKTEEELAEEVAQENLQAAKGNMKRQPNPAGLAQGRDIEFAGDVGNMPLVKPPQGGSGFVRR